MDLGRAFGFIAEDERWLTKILIGGLLLFIPVVGALALIGYMLETARNVAQGNPRPLPEWSNFGDKLVNGLYGFVIQLIYGLPVALLGIVMMCVVLGGVAASGGNDPAPGVVLPLFCFIPLMIVLGLMLQPVLFAAQARYVQTNSLAAALKFGEVISMVRGSLSTWIMLWLVNILCGLVASLGMVFFAIGVLFTAVYAQAVFGHVLGQVVAQQGGVSGSGTPPDYGTPMYQ